MFDHSLLQAVVFLVGSATEVVKHLLKQCKAGREWPLKQQVRCMYTPEKFNTSYTFLTHSA